MANPIASPIVRRVGSNDLLVLQDIGRRTFFESFGDVNTASDMEKYLAEKFSLEHLSNELDNPESTFYFVELNEQVTGYLKINLGKAQTEKQAPDSLEVERIYVLKEYQRQGLGQHLMDLAIEKAKHLHCSYLWLGVWEENPAAIQFYEQMGFQVFDRHTFVLGDDPQTDLLMKLPLR